MCYKRDLNQTALNSNSSYYAWVDCTNLEGLPVCQSWSTISWLGNSTQLRQNNLSETTLEIAKLVKTHPILSVPCLWKGLLVDLRSHRYNYKNQLLYEIYQWFLGLLLWTVLQNAKLFQTLFRNAVFSWWNLQYLILIIPDLLNDSENWIVL